MKAILLAAGYGKRLLPLTAERPKALLHVAGRPMIEHVLERLATVQCIDSVHVVTNGKFHPVFCEWIEAYQSNNGHLNISLFNNGSHHFNHKIGAIGNLYLVLTRENIDDEIVVIAGDNLFSESLEDFVTFAHQKNAPVVALYTIDNLAEGVKYNSIEFNASGQITFFQEKPANPTSSTIGVALYYYPKSSLSLIQQYVTEQNNCEEPGRLVEWMYKRTPFYTWHIGGIWCDVGSREKLDEATRLFEKANQASK